MPERSPCSCCLLASLPEAELAGSLSSIEPALLKREASPYTSRSGCSDFAGQQAKAALTASDEDPGLFGGLALNPQP